MNYSSTDFRLLVAIRANSAADRIEGLERGVRVAVLSRKTGIPVMDLAEVFNSGVLLDCQGMSLLAQHLEVTVEYLLGKEDIEVAEAIYRLRCGNTRLRTNSPHMRAITIPGSYYPVSLSGTLLDEFDIELAHVGVHSIIITESCCNNILRAGDLALVQPSSIVTKGIFAFTCTPNVFQFCTESDSPPDNGRMLGKVVAIVRPHQNLS